MTEPLYFHGGQRGLARGSLLLPPSRSGAKNTISDFAARMVGSWDRDRVYVTSSFDAALIYAVMHPSQGWVYQVEPVGDLQQDTDCLESGLSFACAEARILRIRIPTKWERKDIYRAFGVRPC